MTGTKTANIQTAQWIDTILGNYNGSTRLIPLDRLIALLTALSGPTYATRAELYADRAWPANAIGRVYGDSTAAYNGVYKKSGVSGSGAWTRIADLPTAAVEAALIESIRAEVRLRRAATVWTTDFSTIAFPPGTDTLIQRQTNGNWSLWIATTDAVSTGTQIQTDAAGGRWVRSWGSKDLADIVSALAIELKAADTKTLAAVLAAGSAVLETVTGTGNAATAASPGAYAAVGLSANSSQMALISWPGTNTNIPTAEVTLTIDGVTRNVRTSTGSIPPAGILTNRRLLLINWGGTWRVVNDNPVEMLRSVLPVAGLIRTYGSVAVSNTTSGTVYTANSPTEYLAYGLSAGNGQVISFIPPAANLGPATLALDGGAAMPIMSLAGGVTLGGELPVRPLLLHKWGTTWRVLTEVSAAELADGRIWMATGSLITPAGTSPPAGTKMIVTRTTTSNLVRKWRQGTAPVDGVATDILVQDALGQWWQRVMDYDVYYTRRLLQQGSVLSLFNATGGGDEVSVEFPEQYVSSGLTGVAGAQVLSYTPTATNLTENPTMEFRNVAPRVKYSLVGGSGGNLPVMFFQIGRTYFLPLRGLTARVVAGEGSGIDGMTAISTTAASVLCTNAGKRNPRAYRAEWIRWVRLSVGRRGGKLFEGRGH